MRFTTLVILIVIFFLGKLADKKNDKVKFDTIPKTNEEYKFDIILLYCVSLPSYTWLYGLKYTEIKLQTVQDKDLFFITRE